MADSSCDIVDLFDTPTSIASLFHYVERMLPKGHEVLRIESTASAGEALALMRARGFSQLPVVEEGRVVGIFTYRAFALETAAAKSRRGDPTERPVADFLDGEIKVFASLTTDLSELITELDRADAVMVSTPETLVGLLTPMDVLTYLHRVARAFVVVEEIELSLRQLIVVAIPGPSALRSAVKTVLAEKYSEGKTAPERLEDMTFDEYVALVRDGRLWPQFSAVLGGTREGAQGKLEGAREVRNVIMHFKRELTDEDHRALATCRRWLRRRAEALLIRGDGRT